MPAKIQVLSSLELGLMEKEVKSCTFAGIWIIRWKMGGIPVYLQESA